jgi:cobalt-zinc-cadmium efflux system protein
MTRHAHHALAHSQRHEPALDDPHDHHAHVDASSFRAFRVSTLLNLALVLVEAAIGLAIGSMAVLGDAAHNLVDVLGLALAWGAARLALRRPDPRHTYGYASSTILAALLNATLLFFACGALAWESVRRLGVPSDVPGGWMMLAAGVALLVNGGSAALFWRNRTRDANQRGAFLHLAADAAVSLGVLASGALILATDWHWIDPASALVIALVILVSAFRLMREAVGLALDAVPRGLDVAKIDAALRGLAGVCNVHDLHVWPLSTTVAALTAHLEHDGTRDGDALLADAQAVLRASFGIEHTTIQLENVGCGQRC